MSEVNAITVITGVTPQAAGAKSHVAGDAADEDKVLSKRKACRVVGENARDKAGPVLNGVVGRRTADGGEFRCSAAFKAMGTDGKIGSPQGPAAFVAKPKNIAKMNVALLPSAVHLGDVVAYPDGHTRGGG